VRPSQTGPRAGSLGGMVSKSIPPTAAATPPSAVESRRDRLAPEAARSGAFRAAVEELFTTHFPRVFRIVNRIHLRRHCTGGVRQALRARLSPERRSLGHHVALNRFAPCHEALAPAAPHRGRAACLRIRVAGPGRRWRRHATVRGARAAPGARVPMLLPRGGLSLSRHRGAEHQRASVGRFRSYETLTARCLQTTPMHHDDERMQRLR
jgi:hypothetical protein